MYALDVAKVREVLDFTTVTKIPRTPEFMRGVINLRGNVVPVVDLRLGFGLSKTEKTVNTCIIVVEVDLEGESTIIGALADSVEEVIDLEPDQIEPAAADRHRDQDRFHSWHGEAGFALHHDSGYRQGLLRRGSGPGAGRRRRRGYGVILQTSGPEALHARSGGAGADLPPPRTDVLLRQAQQGRDRAGLLRGGHHVERPARDGVHLSRSVAAARKPRLTSPSSTVDSSIHAMLQVMEKHSSRRGEIEVKLFGGASMRQLSAGRKSVGQSEHETALAVLRQQGFAPRISDTGGTEGRKLRFYSATGEVFVKRIRMEVDI